jgi:hypothetical protein
MARSGLRLYRKFMAPTYSLWVSVLTVKWLKLLPAFGDSNWATTAGSAAPAM